MYVAQRSKHAYLVPEPVTRVGEEILSHSDEGRRRLNQIHKPGFTWSVRIREFLFLPGITLHYVLRKRCIELRTREFLEGGVQQVVCLGAGFDSLALRLSKEFSGVNFIEIDHPDTQRFKVKALQDHRAGNLHYLDIDFTHQNLEDRLQSFEGFARDLRTLFICEGVTMYLSVDEVRHMFGAIRLLGGKGTKFLFTALEPRNSPRNNTRKLLDYYLRLIGEPIKWSMDSTQAVTFLEGQGCKLLSLDDTPKFKELFIKTADKVKLHHGEYVIAAEFL